MPHSNASYSSDEFSRGDGSTVRRRTIRRELVSRIISGRYAPGQRLPLRAELAIEFGAGTGTIQAVMDDLIGDGFLTARTRTGSFVSQRPPHLYRYALAFHDRPHAERSWSRFQLALSRAARRINSDGTGRYVGQYFDVSEDMAVGDYPELLADMRAQRLAGILFSHMAGPVAPPVVHEGNIPRVHFSHGVLEGVHNLGMNGRLWLKIAADFFRQQGRRRIAVLSQAGPYATDLAGVTAERDKLVSAVSELGLTTRREWVHGFAPLMAPYLSLLPSLWMQGHGENRPDALLILDDHMAEGAVENLTAAGLRIPEDVFVISHCNYPAMPKPNAPVTFVGYDCEELLETATATIDHLRRGQPVPSQVDIEPRIMQTPANAPAWYQPVSHREMFGLNKEKLIAAAEPEMVISPGGAMARA